MEARRQSPREFLASGEGWPYLLSVFIPVAVGLKIADASSSLIFASSALGLIPPAALMGRATEELAARSGPGIGGLLNVTFGNAPELIIAVFALDKGLHEVVKATLVGSVIGNSLLVLGAAMLFGGLRKQNLNSDGNQEFASGAAKIQSTMLLLAVAAMVMPGIFELVEGRHLPGAGAKIIDFGSTVERLSLVVAAILIATYLAGLVFSLRTHRDLFNPAGDRHPGAWSVRRSVALLGLAGAVVALMSEILVGSIEETAHAAGLSQFFIGAIVVAIVGNAAEHWVAVLVARKNQMGLAINIAVGSSAQIALFVAPVLVLLSWLVGPHPMPLVFNGFELGAIVLTAIVANEVTQEGESNWFEGFQLLALYAILGVTFYYA